MNTNTVDAKMLGRMFLSGAKNLEAKKEWINELNVFPVPDGDTGTNMTLIWQQREACIIDPTLKTSGESNIFWFQEEQEETPVLFFHSF